MGYVDINHVYLGFDPDKHGDPEERTHVWVNDSPDDPRAIWLTPTEYGNQGWNGSDVSHLNYNKDGTFEVIHLALCSVLLCCSIHDL